jgi:hypothetical protein
MAKLTAHTLSVVTIASMSRGSGQAVPPLPAPLRGQLDHAYVSSDDGYRWGCFGRDYGGENLRTAGGDSAYADCLSRPLDPYFRPTPVYAGLRYGITGVCHQAANRLLKHAGISVEGIRGYGASRAIYGRYGRGGWSEEGECSRIHSDVGVTPPPASIGGSPMSSSKSADISRYLDELREKKFEALATAENAEDLFEAREDLEDLFSTRLGKSYDPNKRALVSDLHHSLQIRRIALTAAMLGGKITTEQYFEEFNKEISGTFAKCEGILGKADFDKLFDTSAGEASGLIDPEIFFASAAAKTAEVEASGPSVASGRKFPSARCSASFQSPSGVHLAARVFSVCEPTIGDA